MKKIWYKWPQGYIVGRLPWYKIFWRLLFAPLLFIGLAFMYVFYFLTQGYHNANHELKNIIGG